MLKKSEYPYYRPAKKGMAWARKVYKKMLINQCECGKLMVNRTSKQKCDECKEKKKRESRLRECSTCGSKFMLMDHQHGGESVCLRCKYDKYKFALVFFLQYFNLNNSFNHLGRNKSLRVFSSMCRNIVQDITGYPEFKIRDIRFASVPKDSETWDHVNAMTYFIQYYLQLCLSDPSKKDFEYFVKYLHKYAVQFKVTPEQNRRLERFQKTGITPEQYISVVGPIIGKTVKESVEIIREHFIHG